VDGGWWREPEADYGRTAAEVNRHPKSQHELPASLLSSTGQNGCFTAPHQLLKNFKVLFRQLQKRVERTCLQNVEACASIKWLFLKS
jgi:hypothetical protein